LLANLRWLSTERVSYPRKITEKLAFHRFLGLSIEIIEQKNREKVIHSQFISTCFHPETRKFGRTQVVQINI
jgi:CTP-dependent riboflavin kinase